MGDFADEETRPFSSWEYLNPHTEMNPHSQIMGETIHSSMMAGATPGGRYEYSAEAAGYAPPLHTALAPADRDYEGIIPVHSSSDYSSPTPSKKDKKHPGRAAAREQPPPLTSAEPSWRMPPIGETQKEYDEVRGLGLPSYPAEPDPSMPSYPGASRPGFTTRPGETTTPYSSLRPGASSRAGGA